MHCKDVQDSLYIGSDDLFPCSSLNEDIEGWLTRKINQLLKLAQVIFTQLLTYDTPSAIKELDPISWDIAKGEWLDQEDGETLVSFDNGSTYFDMSKVEEYVSDRESDEKSA